MEEITLLTVTWKTKELVDILIRSCEKFKPDDLKINYIIVENSPDTSYKEHLESLANNVLFINNPKGDNSLSNPNPPDPGRDGGSNANGMGFELGKKYITTDYTFLCHSDTCVTHKNFFPSLFEMVGKGFELVGTEYDPRRINAIHISGCLVSTEILNSCNIMPKLPKMDVGDDLTRYCKEKKIRYMCYRNTYNDKKLNDLCHGVYQEWGPNCGVDRCLDNLNNVMYIHLGRGTFKKMNRYHMSGKKTHSDWNGFCNNLLEK